MVDPIRWPTALPFEESFDAQIGFSYDSITPETVSGHFDVRPDLLDRAGGVALGVFTTVAEGAASIGTAWAVVPEGMAASGLSNDTTATGPGPVGSGRVSVQARRRSARADLWTWDVECRDEHGELCAVSKVLIAVRPMR